MQGIVHVDQATGVGQRVVDLSQGTTEDHAVRIVADDPAGQQSRPDRKPTMQHGQRDFDGRPGRVRIHNLQTGDGQRNIFVGAQLGGTHNGWRIVRDNFHTIVFDFTVDRQSGGRQTAFAAEPEAGVGHAGARRCRDRERQLVRSCLDRDAMENVLVLIVPIAVAVQVEPAVQVAVARSEHGDGYGGPRSQHAVETDAVVVISVQGDHPAAQMDDVQRVAGISNRGHHRFGDVGARAGHLEWNGQVPGDRLPIGVEFEPPHAQAVDQVKGMAVQDATRRAVGAERQGRTRSHRSVSADLDIAGADVLGHKSGGVAQAAVRNRLFHRCDHCVGDVIGGERRVYRHGDGADGAEVGGVVEVKFEGHNAQTVADLERLPVPHGRSLLQAAGRGVQAVPDSRVQVD